MDAPLNEQIERTLKRKAARKKNDSNFMPVLSLHEQVIALVKDANSKVPQERHVTPRSALIVMNRSLATLSSLDEESKDFAVLKEVSRFLNVATKTFTTSETSSTDLLVAGHPLSALNASLSTEDFLKKNAQWLAADPSINESIRPLVASAHAAMPGSIEREHAFARLNANKTLVASYFKIDNLSPIIAAFSSGNSSAARRARVALQWRDRMGRWVEMGRGINFRFRLPDGSIQVGKGTYVGAGGDTRIENTSSGPSLISDTGLIEVSGVPGLAPGLYAINSDNAAVYQARIPGKAAPEAPSFKDQFDKDIPNVADLTATRRALPIGWKEQGAFYISDDNYAVLPRNGQPYSVLRLDENGRPTGDAIARVRDWAEVNAAIAKDEPAFDKEIARLESDKLPLGRIPGATAKDIINPQDLLRMQERRIQENKAFDEAQPAPQELGNNDLNGNPVPDGWVRDANNDRNYTREMPLRDGGTYPVIARLGEDGTYVAGHASGWIAERGTDGRGPSQKFNTLDEVNKDGLPGFIDYLNDTFTKDNPIVKENKNAVMYYIDEDGNRVSGEAPQTKPITPEQGKKAEQDLRRNMKKNLPPREFPQEPRDDRYDARIVTQDLVEIDKSTLDALNKKMREDSTGEYNMEGVTFYRAQTGPSEKSDTISVIPDGWEPGDKIIANIEPDGSIDWESDAQYDKYAEKVSEALRGMGEGSSAGGTDNLKKVDDALAFLDKHMDASGTTETGAMAISDIQDKVKAGKKALEAGNTESAVGYFNDAYTDLDNGYGEEGSFESSQAGAEALDLLDQIITSLESGKTSGPENSISKEAFNGLKNKIAEENKGGYSKSGLYFFHDLIGSDDGARSKDVTFMIDEDEEFSPLGTISPDGTITWNDPSKQEDWAPALKSALKSFTEGKDKFTKNKSTGYMEYDLGDRYVVSYGKDEDGNWVAEMNRFSRDGGLDSENSFPAKSEADARAMAEGLIDRYNDSQEWKGGDRSDEPPTPPTGGGSGGRTPDSISADDAKELSNLVDNTYSVDALNSDYELYKDKNGDLTLRAHVEDGTKDGVVLSGFTYIDVATVSEDGKVTWKNDSLREEHKDNFIPAMNSILFMYDLNAGRPRPKDFIYFDGETGETIDTSLTEFPESFKEYFDNLTKKVHAAGGSIEDEELSSKELKSLLNRPAGSIFRVFLPKDISNEKLEEIVKASYGDDADDDYVKEYVDQINEQRDGGGPDEPPTPPTGGTPPKTPSPNVPSAPGLFTEFNAPDGAYKLRTVDYSPEGRIDEASRDFTDDPKKLATKFTPQELVQALSQALLGNSTDAAIAEILSANVDDNDDILDPADIQDNIDIPQVNVGQASGAGELEFSAGSEFVLAEALFNAIWEAGLDPNRVVANIYDSANGNNDNLNKLIEAQGGIPSAEEAQLVDDIVQEIRQLKDATSPGDFPIANQKQSPSPEPLPGSLIENIPIDFNNPDYYIPNPEAYIPSQPTVDENGYTDNPEILSADYEVADLMEQMLSGITDGSGAALLAFDNITVEVPIEAMRDALQYQDINTNQILLDLKKESNDMSEPDSEAPTLQAHSQMIKDIIEQTGVTIDDKKANEIRDAIDQENMLDWSEADDAEIIDAITEVAGASIFGKEPTSVAKPQAAETPAAAPIDSPESVTPQFAYPGPRENGYTANNTILDSNGAAVGAGARVQALSDGRAGTVIAVQNIDTKSGRDADYVRIKFDDGTTAVRSARQIFGIDAGAPVEQGQRQGPGQLPPARRRAVPQDPTVRFNEPVAQGTPVIAGNGDTPGVKLADTPQDLVEFTNPNAKQADYTSWGLRAPEIARAGRERVTADSLAEVATKVKNAMDMTRTASTAEERDKAKLEYTKNVAQLEKMVRDTFGARDGVSFGKEGFTLKSKDVGSEVFETGGIVRVDIRSSIMDSGGKQIGTVSRTIRRKDIENPDGTFTPQWHATNDVLKIDEEYQGKGFASAYNRYMENWYIANGFDRIRVHAYAAYGWDGGFVWALNGFNWEGPDEAAKVPVILRRMANDPKTTQEEQQIIKGMQKKIIELNPTGNYTPDTVPSPLEIAQIGAYAESAKTASWAGKRAMLKHDWYGVKHLNPGAVEQRQALNYSQMSKARKRIEDKLNRPNVSRELVLKFNSNEFADANPELAPYIDYIRDVLRNNRSLAVLSPGAKTALNRFTASQLLKGEDKSISLQDIIKLRAALDAEFKADNPLSISNKFGVGDQLLDVSMDDVRRNNVPGFTTKVLGMYESGSNDTYVVTHNDSGQIFFVKKDSLASQYNINGAGAEVQADAMLRASGIAAGYETRVSNADPEIIVMQRAGAGIPLLGEPMTASNALNRMSVTQSDGTTVKVTAQNLMDLLHTPEDAIRIMLIDLVISNMDRHNGNILFAVDGTDSTKIRILPIDHALSSFGPNNDTVERTVIEMFDDGRDNLYGMAMPVLTKRLKQEELLTLFRNEARTMMEGLSNPANLPTGKELDLIISNFGSLDAYRQKIQERLDAILQPGGEGHQVMLNVLKPVYWA